MHESDGRFHATVLQSVLCVEQAEYEIAVFSSSFCWRLRVAKVRGDLKLPELGRLRFQMRPARPANWADRTPQRARTVACSPDRAI